MGDEITRPTNATAPNGVSTGSSTAGSPPPPPAVRAILAQLSACWPAATFDDRDRTGAWSSAIEGLIAGQVKHGIKQLPLLDSQWPPAPGQFRAICLTWDRPRAERPNAKQIGFDMRIDPETPRGIAWEATAKTFWNRLFGGVLRIGNVEVPAEMAAPATAFDAEYVAFSAQLPQGSSTEDHRAAWNDLRTRFENQWREGAGAR